MVAQNIIIIIGNAAPPRRNDARCITKQADGALHFEGLCFCLPTGLLRFVDFGNLRMDGGVIMENGKRTLEVRWHGRGGQGAKAHQLRYAQVLFEEGSKHVRHS